MKYAVYCVLVALTFSIGCKQKATDPESSSGNSKGKNGGKTVSHHTKAAGILKGSLVDADGASIGVSKITSKKYLLVYYAAEWNPESKGVTTELVKKYGKDHTYYELVFVSADRSEEKMMAYMKESKMPWPAVKYRSAAHRAMAQFRKGGALPCLVLLDKDDNRLAGSYDEAGKTYIGPENAYHVLEDILEKEQDEREEELRRKEEERKEREKAKQEQSSK